MTDFDETIKEAESNRKAAAMTLADMLERASYNDTAQRIRNKEVLDIEVIARKIRDCDDPGLTEAMRKCVKRYARARNTKIEYEVKNDLKEELARELEYHKSEGFIDENITNNS